MWRVDEKIDEGVIQWFRHVERIENKSLGRPQKRLIDTANNV